MNPDITPTSDIVATPPKELANLELIPASDPLISAELDKFDFQGDNKYTADQIAQTLVALMEAHNGLGLSANQVGLPYRVFAMRTDPVVVCFNPVIVDAAEKMSVMEEGCLTFPNLFVKVRRPGAIRVRFQNKQGEVQTEKFSGMTARIFQHELDHLDGITMLDRASKIHINQAKKRQKILNRRQR